MAKTYSYLTLVGDVYDTERVTELMKITPDSIRKKGEPVGKNPSFGFTEWSLESGEMELDNVQAAINAIMEKVPCTPEIMRQVADETSAEWNLLIVVYFYGGQLPNLSLSSDTIRFAEHIGAVIGFDRYFCI